MNKIFYPSKIARLPIQIPEGVIVTYQDNILKVHKDNYYLAQKCHESVIIQISNESVLITVNDAQDKKHQGTTASNLINMIKGITIGFTKSIKLKGLGYKASIQGSKLEMALGFSHSVIVNVPEDIKATLVSATEISFFSKDIKSVSQFAAKIRSIRPPDSYRGQGVLYSDEVIVLKQSKRKK